LALGGAVLLDVAVAAEVAPVRWALVAAALVVGAALVRRVAEYASAIGVDRGSREASPVASEASMEAYAKTLARSLRALYGKSCAFVLLAAPVGQRPTTVQYVSNLGRGDGTDLLRRLFTSWEMPTGVQGARLPETPAQAPADRSATTTLADVLNQPSFFGALWQVLEYTDDAVILWQMDGAGILYWNQAAESLYGYGREEVRGRVIHTLLKTVPSGTGIAELEERLARYGMWVGELQHTTRDGKRVLVQSRLSLIAQIDGKWLVLELNRDVTDRVDAEQLTRVTEDLRKRLNAGG
jgi:PAS domain S-box-containing protein